MKDKIKILTLGDHPLSPSGVGTQTRYIVEGMLNTGKYKFISLAGAIRHEKYDVIKTEEYRDDWLILPVDGYGNKELLRSVIRNEKPDILWFMTDPRFWRWLWEMENEIRPLMPMIYYHVWDNYPYPQFNRPYYLSNDHVACISRLTHDIVDTVAPEVENSYVPHNPGYRARPSHNDDCSELNNNLPFESSIRARPYQKNCCYYLKNSLPLE